MGIRGFILAHPVGVVERKSGESLKRIFG